jgi:2,3-dihydroxy-p-cumate/2,3-dihydroxybenzoate 3,4-dioxygenase
MIELKDVRYCRLGTSDLEGTERFATTILGLEVAERTRSAIYFKSDQRDHTLCYFEGEESDQAAAFELGSSDDLHAAATALEKLGQPVHYGTREECELRKVREFISFSDPSGNKLEFVVRPAQSGRRYHGTRDAGVTGFSHIGLNSTDVARDEAFWTEVCNARVSDRIGDAPLLRLGSVHHAIALFPWPTPGIQHINHQVQSTDDVQRSHRFLLEHQVPIVFGPGRHVTSMAQFLYFRGPHGLVFEYSVGVTIINDEPAYRERQLPFDPSGFCGWGAKPQIQQFQN